MVVDLRNMNQKKLKQEKIMADQKQTEEQYETEVKFYNRYNIFVYPFFSTDTR